MAAFTFADAPVPFLPTTGVVGNDPRIPKKTFCLIMVMISKG